MEKAESEKNMRTYFLWNGGVRVVISNEIWKIDLLWDIGRFSVVVTPASPGLCMCMLYNCVFYCRVFLFHAHVLLTFTAQNQSLTFRNKQ